MKRRSTRSKKKSQYMHARRRASERYGINLSKSVNQDLVKQIQSGEARHVEKQTNRVSLWEVEHEDRTMRVVYDKQRQVIVSALPLDGKSVWDELEEEMR